MGSFYVESHLCQECISLCNTQEQQNYQLSQQGRPLIQANLYAMPFRTQMVDFLRRKSDGYS